MKIPPSVRKAFEDSGLPWSVDSGKRHLKLRLDGRFVGILPLDGLGNESGRAVKNTVAQIKRAAKEATCLN